MLARTCVFHGWHGAEEVSTAKSADVRAPGLTYARYICSMVSMLSSAKEKNPPADNDMHLDAAGGKSAKEIKGWDFHDHEA